MAKKKEEALDPVEVFKNLQDFGTRAGAGRTEFTLNRPDGWKWQFAAIAPGYSPEEEKD